MSKTNAPLPASGQADCLGCRHYHITWDPSFPYGCRAMDFKSKRKPHLDVLESSGDHCLHFEARPQPVRNRT